jgi:hypothetical protein
MMAYQLTTNAGLIAGALGAIFFKLPLVITTVLAFTIDLTIKAMPSVSYINISKKPDYEKKRKSASGIPKGERLLSAKIVRFSFFKLGFVQMAAAGFVYFKVFNDYGFKTKLLYDIENQYGYLPDPSDVYDPFTFGRNNTNYGNPQFLQKMDWIISDGGYNGVDLRLFYADFSPEDWGKCRWDLSTLNKSFKFFGESRMSGGS